MIAAASVDPPADATVAVAGGATWLVVRLTNSVCGETDVEAPEVEPAPELDPDPELAPDPELEPAPELDPEADPPVDPSTELTNVIR